MKTKLLSLLLLSGFLFASCEKDHHDKDDCKKYCKGNECYPCKDNNFEDPENVKEGVTKYIVEPLVVSQECGCIVSGMVKYVKDSKTVALVKYGDGQCDGYALKILCVDGDCEHKKAGICKFKQKCASGPSSTEKAL